MTGKQKRWIAFILLGSAILVIALDPEFGGYGSWSEELLHFRKQQSLLGACVIYAICIAIPFVPGVELGLLIMLVFGEQGIIAAYLSTILGLNAAFAVGRLSRNAWWKNSLYYKAIFSRIDLQYPNAGSARPSKLTSFAERSCEKFRYPALGLLFNLPGNSVIGGGGGIAMLSGSSRLFSWPQFALTVALATCVVPLLAYLGMINIEMLITR